MPNAITAAELREMLTHLPDSAILLMETDSGCFAEIERPEVPNDTVPPFSLQQAEPANCQDSAKPKTGQMAQTAVCLIPGKHWRITD